MFRRTVVLAIIFAPIVFGQALRGLTGTRGTKNASVLLARARKKILTSTRRMPKYTCLETIDRKYYIRPVEKHRPRANQPARLSLDAEDRLRVDVAEAGQNEIHSWPGASRFDTRSIDEMIPLGPISTGSFGGYLAGLFANSGARIKFIGSKTDGSRSVFEYAFRVPRQASDLRVKARNVWRVTGTSGSFEIDAATAQLTRLVIETDPLSPDTGMFRATTAIDYHSLLIGDGEYLIPLRSELKTFDTDGGQTDSVTEFSGCREYTAESAIRFGDSGASMRSIKIGPRHVAALPPGISFTLALIGSLDLRTAAAGDPVSARVVHSVRAKGSKKVLVPKGAIAHGRLLEVGYQFSTSKFLISIGFSTLETNGAVSPLSVRLDRELKAERRTRHGLVKRGTEFSLPPPVSMGPGSLFAFRAERRAYVIPAGFQSKWTTVTPVSMMLLNAQQSSTDPVDLLEQARDRLVARLPPVGYACVATINRSYFSRQKPAASPTSCETLAADRKNGRDKLRLDKTDRLRVEVTLNSAGETYSWTGPGSFSRNIDEMLHSGDIGTGVLGAQLGIILTNPLVRFWLLSQNDKNLEFGFRVPLDASSYVVRAGTRWRETGYDGVLSMDPASLVLKRVTIQTEELPKESSLCEASTTLEYPASNEGVLLPSAARTRDLNRDTTETEWDVTFSECGLRPPQVPGRAPAIRFPSISSAPFKRALVTPIDTSTAAAGDVITARLIQPMLTRSSKVLAPAGAILAGRIMRIEHHLDSRGITVSGPNSFRGRFFLVWLDFDTIEVNGVVSSIHPRLICGETPNPLHSCLVANMDDRKGDRALLFPSDAANLVIPAGYKSTWLNRAVR